MPVWSFKYSRDALSESDKVDLAKDITQLYINVGLPAFYVNVQFFEMGPTEMFVGGETRPNSVSLSIAHVARTFESEAIRFEFLKKIDLILERLIKKDLDLEYFIVDSLRQQWKIHGMYPPSTGSDEEKEWVRLNRPVEHNRAYTLPLV